MVSSLFVVVSSTPVVKPVSEFSVFGVVDVPLFFGIQPVIVFNDTKIQLFVIDITSASVSLVSSVSVWEFINGNILTFVFDFIVILSPTLTFEKSDVCVVLLESLFVTVALLLFH